MTQVTHLSMSPRILPKGERTNQLIHKKDKELIAGRTLTIQFLRVCKNNTLLFLKGLINRVDDYLLNKRYRK